MEVSLAVVLILLILLIVFNGQVCSVLARAKTALLGLGSAKNEAMSGIVDDDALLGALRGGNSNHREHLEGAATLPPGQVSDVLTVLGYTGEQPWQEVVKATELDPSTFANHNEFVKDVRRYSSGANFTSVQDDNTNSAFTNFVGLRRPSHVPIGSTARQQPDIDQGVLSRNKRFAFVEGPNFTGHDDDGSE
jgi:hypothetical protein